MASTSTAVVASPFLQVLLNKLPTGSDGGATDNVSGSVQIHRAESPSLGGQDKAGRALKDVPTPGVATFRVTRLLQLREEQLVAGDGEGQEGQEGGAWSEHGSGWAATPSDGRLSPQGGGGAAGGGHGAHEAMWHSLEEVRSSLSTPAPGAARSRSPTSAYGPAPTAQAHHTQQATLSQPQQMLDMKSWDGMPGTPQTLAGRSQAPSISGFSMMSAPHSPGMRLSAGAVSSSGGRPHTSHAVPAGWVAPAEGMLSAAFLGSSLVSGKEPPLSQICPSGPAADMQQVAAAQRAVGLGTAAGASSAGRTVLGGPPPLLYVSHATGYISVQAPPSPATPLSQQPAVSQSGGAGESARRSKLGKSATPEPYDVEKYR